MPYSKSKIFSVEMGFTRQEFITLLENQDKLVYERAGNVVTFTFSNKTVRVTLGEEEVRRIASARIPMLEVSFNFLTTEKPEQAAFMKLFLTKFHKGGG
ncbi:MAG: hypothetical protein JKX87_03720 [Cycloclasticus sp.]|nr:hypothetical protein [Cycloclasticus sp.]